MERVVEKYPEETEASMFFAVASLAVSAQSKNTNTEVMKDIGNSLQSLEKYPLDNEHLTPLHYAAQNGHIDVVKFLIGGMENKQFQRLIFIISHHLALPYKHFFSERCPSFSFSKKFDRTLLHGLV